MEQFASGWKRNYYGKGDVIVYRLNRTASESGGLPVFGANVKILIYGEAFWPTYTTGDNTGLVATDSMKNFVQRETLGFAGDDLESYCRYLAQKFLDTYGRVEGVQITAVEVPYQPLARGVGFAPRGPERAVAQVELGRSGMIDVMSGLRGFRLLRLSGSAFHGFVRDEYTTLPDQFDRPLHMWLDLEWRYTDLQAAFAGGRIVSTARDVVHDAFETFESGSIQQIIHLMGARLLGELADLSEVHLEASNRTWNTIAEQGSAVGIYTEPQPPYGCLGLRLKRTVP
jgi:urate oxidase / 2-oxo-4-hydroxy-4-carboxy-5-ureidoimidazoline decarboxylase